jgi:hypothetical protein
MALTQMWFGTRDYMQWINMPAIDSDMSKVGWQTQSQYINGGSRIRRSLTGHKEYNLAWPLQSRDDIREITDYADGIYGNGNIYFLDPFAMDRNVLPQYWATPALAADDAPILFGTTAPTTVDTGANSYSYPVKSAVYSLSSATTTKAQLFIPLAPGTTGWIGAHGTSTGSAAVRVTPTIGASGTGTAVNLTLLSSTTDTRVNQSFSGDLYSGVLIELYTASTGTITLSGLMMQVLDSAATPQVGSFISGLFLFGFSNIYGLTGTLNFNGLKLLFDLPFLDNTFVYYNFLTIDIIKAHLSLTNLSTNVPKQVSLVLRKGPKSVPRYVRGSSLPDKLFKSYQIF